MRLAPVLVVASSALACGGVTAIDESAAPPGDAAAPPAVPSFGDAGITTRAPVACEPCADDAACGGQAACVASEGAAFCAPGCSKDGFCPSDRTCTWVRDPAGQTWRACLPDGDPCGPRVLRPRGHAGTW
jgi:hypothetical protein